MYHRTKGKFHLFLVTTFKRIEESILDFEARLERNFGIHLFTKLKESPTKNYFPRTYL